MQCVDCECRVCVHYARGLNPSIWSASPESVHPSHHPAGRTFHPSRHPSIYANYGGEARIYEAGEERGSDDYHTPVP